MEGKRKIIIFVIIGFIIILGVVGVVSINSYGKKEMSTNTVSSSEANESVDDQLYYFDSYEEAIEVIQEYYSPGNAEVSFVKEEDECWYFVDTNGEYYSYCIGYPIILPLGKEYFKNGK